MKYTMLAVLISCLCVPAKADSITNLNGQLFLPGESLTYNFQVQTSFHNEFGGFVEDILNGQALIFDDSGNLQSTINFADDFFVFGLNESLILFEFAIFAPTEPFAPPIVAEGYDFVGSANGVTIEHIPHIPEPGTLALALVGLALCCSLANSNFRRVRCPSA